jgi:hypothetical protein
MPPGQTISRSILELSTDETALVRGVDRAKGKLRELDTSALAAGTGFGRVSTSLQKFDDVLGLAGGPHLRGIIQGVGQLDEVARGASGSLDLMAKAGLVASAAMGGWSIGRKLAELTGSDALIGNLTAKLMGFGDVAGQQAAAGADTLARASANAGRQITDMSEALRINEAAAKAHTDALSRATASTTLAGQLSAWRHELDALQSSGVLESLRKDILSGNFSQQDLADRYRISTNALSLFTKQVNDTKQEQEKAADAAKRHAEAIQSVVDKLSGAGLVAAAKELEVALQKLPPIQSLTVEAQVQIAKTMDDAIAVYRAAGKAIPQAWLDIQTAATLASQKGADDMLSLIQMIQSLEREILTIPEMPLPNLKVKVGFEGLDLSQLGAQLSSLEIPKVSLFAKMFGSPQDFGASLAGAIMGAIQGGGSVINAAGGVVGQQVGTSIAKSLSSSLTKEGSGLFSKALGGVFASVLPGLGALIGPLAGALWKKLFGGHDGRNMVKQFIADNFGDASELQRQLLELGPDYDRLWRGLTQLGDNASTQEAQAAIDAVTAALEANKKKAGEAADAAAAAAAETAASQAAAVDAIKAKYAEGFQAIDNEYKKLNDSVAAEAEEAEMGVQERNDRARMEELEKQRAALEQQQNDEIAAKQETFANVLVEGQQTREKLDEIFGGSPLKIPYQFVPQNGLPEPIPMADGGTGRALGPTLFYSRGNEDFAFSGEGRSFGLGAVASRPIDVTVVSQLDGRVVARNQKRYLPDTLAQDGVGR